MTSSVCCPDRRDLQRMALGQVSEAEDEQLGRHVLNCLACAELLNSFQADDPLLMDLLAGVKHQAFNDIKLAAEALMERLADTLPGHGPLELSAVFPVENPELAPSDARLPERLGRYHIVGRLGAGGMGMVCRGHDPQLRRDVAIKVPTFNENASDRTTARQRFLREARAAAAVRHPHICPIYDVGEDSGQPYVVMALVEGESLAERIKRQGRFENVHAAVTLVAQIADALAAIHAANIIHRDLKPGNILLDRAGQPFLADFGLARSHDSEQLTYAGALIGTPAYLSPEQAAPELGPVGPWSDQYSLGVVLYQLLTGRRPFEAPTLLGLIHQIGTQSAPPPSLHRPDLDPKLEAICLRVLATKPAMRFGSIREFAASLTGYLRDVVDLPALGAVPETPPAGVARSQVSPSEDHESSRLYVAARYYLEKRTEVAHRKSIATYYQILDGDPTFALAWAGLAFAYHLLSVRGYVSPTNACPKAKSAALRALSLDNSLGEAHRVLATVLMEFDWNLHGAELAFKRALELKPNDAVTHQLYGKCLACLGRHDEAIASLRLAEELDPLSPILSTSLGRHGFFLARMYDQAVRQYQRTLEIDATFWLTHRFLGWAYLFQGKQDAAVAELAKARQLNDDSLTLASLGHAYGVCGQQTRAREVLNELMELAQHRYVSPDCQALVYLGLGENDLAFTWLTRAVEDRSEWLCKIRVDPFLDPLRADPRFDALMQHMNVTS